MNEPSEHRNRPPTVAKYAVILAAGWTLAVGALSAWEYIDRSSAASDHGVMWLLGLAMLVFGAARARRREREREQAEEALRKREAFLNLLLETIPVSVFYKDGKGRYLGCNKAFETLLGRSREQLIGKSVFDLYPPDLAQVYYTHDSELFDKPGTQVYDSQLTDAHGAVHDVVFHKATIINDVGFATGLIGAVLDVTERNRAEEALRESRGVLKAVLDSIPVRVFWKDKDLVFLGCNTPFARDAGFEKPEDIVGRDDRAMGWREQAELYRADDRTVIESGEARLHIEEPQTTPSGEQIHLLTSKVPLRDADGAIVGVLGTYQNITDHKRAEEALRESEERLRQTLDAANVVAWEISAVDRTHHETGPVDKVFGRPSGYRHQEVRDFFASIHPDDRGHVTSAIDKALHGEGPYSMEYRVPQEDGSLRWLSGNGTLQKDAMGRPLRLLGVARDITERKRTEEALEKRLVALTSPLEGASGITLDQLFNLESLQQLQDDFARATGVASLITHPDGTPITEPSGFCRLCNDVIRMTDKGRANCYQSDAVIGRPAVDGPTIKPCMSAGLWDAGAGISVGGRHIANWLVGQVRDETQTEEKMREYAREIGADETATIEAFREVPSMSREQFERVAKMVYTLANQLSAIAYQNVQQARFITKRRLAEEQLSQLSARDEALLASVPDIIMEVDVNKVYTWANRAGYEFFGDDVIGKPAEHYFEGEQETYNAVQPLFVGKEDIIYIESWQRRRDGAKRLLAWWCKVRKDAEGKPIGGLSTARDITEEKQAQDALRRSENRYQELFNSVMEGIGILDENDVIQYCNPAFVNLLEAASQEELIGRCLSDFVPEEQRAEVLAQAKLRRKGLSKQYELAILTAKGRRKTILASVSPRFDDQNRYSGAVETMIDVTETKRLRDLESRAQRLETAGQIAGQVAHDFNNMLAPMMAYPELIREQLPEGDPGIKYLEAIEDMAQKIADLNQQLLTLSRRGHYNQEVLNLNPVVKQVLRDMAPLPETLVVEADLCADLINVKGGRAQLHRAIMNLVLNARDATQNVGRISVKTENYYVDDTTICYGQVPRGEYVRVTISDTGCGITGEVAQRIFDPFFTTKTTDKKRGSGLGLSVVDAVVKDHDGFVDMSTKLGEGTSFYLYFPITRAAVNEKTSDEISGGTETILVVDDDEMQRDVSARLLTILGYKVRTCDSGTRAIEILRNNPFDLLILDMIMPNDIDGTETYRRAAQIRPDQKAIIVSGFAESDRVAEAQRLGAGTFVKKPLSRKVMALAVRQELDRQVEFPVPD